MISKIQNRHLEKLAYIYLRQSTIAQVRNHRESTERQYALKDKALSLGWHPAQIKILDGDLGLSGAQSTHRKDFKMLVADVSMNQVGAVFSLEASRLSRSNADWYRLLELCSLTGTLIIDEDGCYDPADFNDQLLLGLKGTMSAAELHFIRARLQGGRINKAKKGELRAPLPVGYVYDDDGHEVIDPDKEVVGSIKLLFDAFRETQSAYGVVRYFFKNGLKFPKRAYGGVWNGKLIWGHLIHGRVLGVLKNPQYAGAYVYGRYGYEKSISEDGQIKTKTIENPMENWKVLIKDHHESYISWSEFLKNGGKLAMNQTNGDERLLPGPAREGLALLQGLLICAECGHKISIRYTGNGGIYPCYQCVWKKRDGISHKHCISIAGRILDEAISARIVQVLQPPEINLAIKAFDELEQRTEAVDGQWKLKIERVKYEVALAQRRYEEVDPANRLVASTLEKRWNESLQSLEEICKDYDKYQKKEGLSDIAGRKSDVLALGKSFPRLWESPTTKAKDRKRILRLVIKDITVRKLKDQKKVQMQIRWQGGANEEMVVDIPPNAADKWRHSPEIVNRVREMAKIFTDEQIAEKLNEGGLKTNKGNDYTISGLKWIRHKHSIPSPQRMPGEMTVTEVAAKFKVSEHVVYYWIERKKVKARKINSGSPWWITLETQSEKELRSWSETSTRISNLRRSQVTSQ